MRRVALSSTVGTRLTLSTECIEISMQCSNSPFEIASLESLVVNEKGMGRSI